MVCYGISGVCFTFTRCLYFIYARKIYVRTHVKITRELKSTLILKSWTQRSVLVLRDTSEFTQQDGRKKRTAKLLCVTNVTRL